MPFASCIISRTSDIEGEYFSLGKVVFEQLMIGHTSVVYRTPRASLSGGWRKRVRRERERERERER